MKRLTDEQIRKDNPHFKGEIIRGKIVIFIEIIKPYRIHGTDRFTELQKYLCYIDVTDSVTGWKASYLWDSIKKQWSLGAN